MSNYNTQLQSLETGLQQVLQTLQNKAAGGGEQATPEISINNSTGLITATAGTKFSNYQLAFQPAKTIAPSATSQVAVSANYFTGGAVTVAGDANLVAENIKSGVSIFGVNGTLEAAEWSENEDAIVSGTITNYTNDRVTNIGQYAFHYCNSLTSVNFPVCTDIGKYAFYVCNNLTSVNFPVCTIIGYSAFYACNKLTSVNFPVCTNICGNAFAYCNSLTSVNFPVCTNIDR